MQAEIKGQTATVLLRTQRIRRNNPEEGWLMVRIAEITEDMEEFLKSGYFDPDDEEIIYAADPMWENHRVYRPLTDIAWIEIRFVDFVGEIDSNKGAASLLKKR